MPKPRVFSGSDGQSGTYHICTTLLDGVAPFDEKERDALTAMLRPVEAFHRIQILTFCLLPTKLHLLILVPERPAGAGPDVKRVMKDLAAASEPQSAALVAHLVRGLRDSGDDAGLEAWRQGQLSRMYSMSEFMKTVKMRFSSWINRRRGRNGSLWAGRYRNLIVEEKPRPIRTVAAYIDLAPVREGQAARPENYRWCGIAAAVAGEAAAVKGIRHIMQVSVSASRRRESVAATIDDYRAHLAGKHAPPPDRDGSGTRRKDADADSAPVYVDRARLLQPVRHLTDGVVFGSREFVDDWFHRNRSFFSGRSRTERKDGARAIGDGWPHLFTLRQLVKGVKR